MNRDRVIACMDAFLQDPSLPNAQALEVALDDLRRGPGGDYYGDLGDALAQYRPEGGEHLYSRSDLVPWVERARKRFRGETGA